MSKPSDEQLEARFRFRPLRGDQGERLQLLHRKVGELARAVVTNTPAGPHQNRCLDSLDMILCDARLAIEEE